MQHHVQVMTNIKHVEHLFVKTARTHTHSLSALCAKAYGRLSHRHIVHRTHQPQKHQHHLQQMHSNRQQVHAFIMQPNTILVSTHYTPPIETAYQPERLGSRVGAINSPVGCNTHQNAC
jgi:hypothetical protein